MPFSVSWCSGKKTSLFSFSTAGPAPVIVCFGVCGIFKGLDDVTGAGPPGVKMRLGFFRWCRSTKSRLGFILSMDEFEPQKWVRL